MKKSFFGKKSRSALVLVLIISLAIHLVAVIIFGAIKFVEAIREEEKVLESVTIEEVVETKPVSQVNIQERTKSTPPPRPQAIAVDSPLELDIPSLDIDVNIETSAVVGRTAGSFGGGISELKNSALEASFTDFGYTGPVAGTLRGLLFDTKQDPNGRVLVTEQQLNDRSFLMGRMQNISTEFTSGSWSLRALEREYFKAGRELYASYWVIGKGPAENAPAAFGVEDDVEPKSIIALYEGSFTPEESGEFRFLGKADDILVVRIGSEIVLDGSYYNKGSNWKGSTGKGPQLLGIGGFPPQFGSWMRWEKGKAMEMQVLIGEGPGGIFGCCLLYQKKGEERLRVFSTKPLTASEKRNLEAIDPQVADWL